MRLLLGLEADTSQEEDIITWEESGTKAILPGEDGNYQVPIGGYPEFVAWRSERRDIFVKGTLSYSLDESRFSSIFEAHIQFSTVQPEADAALRIRWRNKGVT